MYGKVIDNSDTNYNYRSYKVQFTRMTNICKNLLNMNKIVKLISITASYCYIYLSWGMLY